MGLPLRLRCRSSHFGGAKAHPKGWAFRLLAQRGHRAIEEPGWLDCLDAVFLCHQQGTGTRRTSGGSNRQDHRGATSPRNRVRQISEGHGD